MLQQLVSLVFALSVLGLLLFFLFYPMIVLALSRLRARPKPPDSDATSYAVSMVTVVHRAEALMEEKIKNFRALNYPSDRLELVVYEDGLTTSLAALVNRLADERIRLHGSPAHQGKIEGLNAALPLCRGEIVVFSDADALLAPDALLELLRSLADPAVGGVCGRRVIAEREGAMTGAQRTYIGFDETIRDAESRLGSTTSNDGKLYAIRRSLYQNIPPAVTDDLYVCLSVVRQKYRFVFAPRARAYIKLPSRNPRHEIIRRRRIVSTSLRGIFDGDILNPFKHGVFSLQLFINKVLRRCMPFCLLGLFMSSLFLAKNQFDPWISFPGPSVVLSSGLVATAPVYAHPAAAPADPGIFPGILFHPGQLRFSAGCV